MSTGYFDESLEECMNTTAPMELSITSAGISAFLLVVTVPTNLLICLAIIVDPNRELRTQFNCFTFNLGLADLIVGCVAEPFMIFAHITEAVAPEHEVSSSVNIAVRIPYFILTMASILSIAALACERYFAIISPFCYREHFNVKLTVIISSVIWIVAITFGMLIWIMDYVFESFILINFGVLFTGVLVCFASCRICARLKKTSKQWQKNEMHREKDNLTQMKLTRTLGLMVGTFMLCYVSAGSMIYYINVCTNCNCGVIQWFRDAAFWLILLNSAIDPYVYAIRSSQFRAAIYKILKCSCQRRKSFRTFPALRYSKQRKNRKRANYGALSSTDSSQVSCHIEQLT
ncbi:adrenocorticotropic hormone receptor-like [Dendronephthya gigantea]|uniref:adrenocorticotropic hormone receptor-like n=1 Tax=Dendronephthya gigantea TaxID=151771 RepID=UPI00106D3885|nr:adrenocorticotropic hormone receptor-like [Dendronephthya gigantea]